MSDVQVARDVLSSYAKLQVANPINQTADQANLKAAGQIEKKIALSHPSDDNVSLAEANRWKSTPEYWVAGGEIVAQDLTRPLTCILFAHLCVYALKSTAPKFTVPIEVVEMKKLHDNHYILVAGRKTGTINGKLSDWNQEAFVIDLWGFCQGLGNLVAQPPAIIVSQMADYPRKTVVTIPAWGV
ncbi:hypothetical protein [Nonomuraea basaltis]|uniref:hypothetical protein n=1 Tax=Nonomuraea basaltis TaxID=2495887 RepID=UPI00110C643B|nr:hypothetical protein [Nonomuraea basaltis]TMR97530.1 hypothetical protein EJK15_17575 [Nonomuraea basaltis]